MDREIGSLKEKIEKLSDPVIMRFERDALVQTHQMRIKELEGYNKIME